MSEQEWIGQLDLLGIKDGDLFSEADAGLIRSAAGAGVSGTTTKEKPKKTGKGGKLTRQAASEGTAIDASSVGQAFAGQLATSRSAGEQLATENLQALAGGYKERMAAGLAMFANASTSFLQRAIALDGEVEVEEQVPLDQMMGEIFEL